MVRRVEWRWDQVIRSSDGARLAFVGCPKQKGPYHVRHGLRPEPEKTREVEKEAERVCGVCVCEQGQHDVMSQPKART